MSKKLKRIHLSLTPISVLDAGHTTGGRNTYSTGCDTDGNPTHDKATVCLTSCKSCPPPGNTEDPGSHNSRSFSSQNPPCFCYPCC